MKKMKRDLCCESCWLAEPLPKSWALARARCGQNISPNSTAVKRRTLDFGYREAGRNLDRGTRSGHNSAIDFLPMPNTFVRDDPHLVNNVQSASVSRSSMSVRRNR